jgi:DNA-binding transcriptional LysR family regulator
MKFRHLEYFVAAAEELNFTHAAVRLNVSQPPFSKQIHDLEAELGIELFQRQQKGVALTAAGRAFLLDAKGILEASEAAVKKAQRISRGEIGALTVGYLPALTHDFLGSALERWRSTPSGIVVDCVEMGGAAQERAFLEGRIDVGVLVRGERPVLQLLRMRPLVDYPARVALPQAHPLAERSPVPLGLLRHEPLVGLNRLCPTYDDWLRTACRSEGFVPQLVKEADGPSSALAFVAAGFGLAVVSQPVERVAAPRGGVPSAGFPNPGADAAGGRLEARRGVGRRSGALCGRAGAGLRAERRGVSRESLLSRLARVPGNPGITRGPLQPVKIGMVCLVAPKAT